LHVATSIRSWKWSVAPILIFNWRLDKTGAPKNRVVAL
jgi:hypothetical protein